MLPFSRPASRSKLAYASVVLVPLLLLLTLGWLSHQTVDSLEQARLLVNKTLTVKRDLALLLSTAVDGETGQRGYILTRNEEFLAPYQAALIHMPAIRERIGSTIIDPTARTLYHTLTQSLDTRMRFTAEAVSMEKEGRHEEVVALISSGKGKRLMDQVRTDLAALDARQDALMQQREAWHRQCAARNEIASWTLAGADVVFVALLIYFLIKWRRAQAFLRVCAWSRTVEFEGQWLSFEQYLEARFGVRVTHGISPEEAAKFTSGLGPAPTES